MRNTITTNTFHEGHSTDLVDNVESNKTFEKGWNGRLYSKNGKISLRSIKGSEVVFANDTIIKYLGFHSFKDEIIVFVKSLKVTSTEFEETETEVKSVSASFFEKVISIDETSAVYFNNELSNNSEETITSYATIVVIPVDGNFDIDFSCGELNDEEIDMNAYFKVNRNTPNFQSCTINTGEVPLNNKDFYDAIYSLKPDSTGKLSGTLLWTGFQNWPIDAKITTEGTNENQFYKRVYYTDAFNYRRVVNVKDKNLIYRQGPEFNQILDNILLEPEVISIEDGGQLKSMKSFYAYRIISENGQVSEFSSLSEEVVILVKKDAIEYRGGSVSENTNNLVNIKCNIMNANKTSKIECIAIEHEAFGPPTAIRNLGIKTANNVVYFKHYGNEPEFADNITYQDIIEFKNTFKYCNDYSSKKNKLIAGGLRNTPLSTAFNELDYLMPLHSWDENGNTHNCLMNPKPWEFRYVDPSNTQSLIYIKRRLYKTISSFGVLYLRLKNKLTSESIMINISEIENTAYTDITGMVTDWLLGQQANNPNFPLFFPNLEVKSPAGQLLFSPIDENIKTNMSNYIFESNNPQFIEDVDNDIQFLPSTVDVGNLVYGAQSIGFNEGTGVRITYRTFERPLLKQATSIYTGSGNLLDFETPTGEKFCMKGEIYRLAIQGFETDSTRLFSIPLGDVMIPELGEFRREINDNGDAMFFLETYVNQSVKNGVLYGHGIKMHIEVRFNCELQKIIPMYKMLYVQRTEENRTILCQGIAAPLSRIQDTGRDEYKTPDVIRNKWTLPYYGGPTYEKVGFDRYDEHGNDYNYTGEGHRDRVIASRNMMYFDSPDLYFGKISDQYIKNSKINIVAKLNTDHTPSVIRERGGAFKMKYNPGYINFGNEIYPKFSRKILEKQILGDNHSENLPDYASEYNYDGTFESHFVNVSVLANYTQYKRSLGIDKHVTLKRGEMVSGTALGVNHDLSNNAFVLPSQPWYYGSYQRNWQFNSGSPRSDMFNAGKTSPGYKTTFIKTSEDLFTNQFIGPLLPTVDNQIRVGGSEYGKEYDTFPLINIFRNNRESIFGGRTRQAYSQNTYVSLSKTIPMLRSSNGTQYFDVGADTFMTLNIRTKNDYSDEELNKRSMNNHGGAKRQGDLEVWERKGAWCYAVVLESQVEPKMTYEYEFYRQNGNHDFEAVRNEIINAAYLNDNVIKEYIPKPFGFRDDPNLDNVIAVSNPKLAGEYYDNWTFFKPNNFYDLLEKNKGAVTNLVREKDSLFAIQEHQTSELFIGTDRIINDASGNPVNIKQGSGTVVDGHTVRSGYGTSIRRATIESDYGFIFFDEREVEFIKIVEPMLIQRGLHLHYFNMFKDNPIINTEAFFDVEHKESNILIQSENGQKFIVSYSEVLKAFNPNIDMTSDLFMNFDKKVFAPIRTSMPSRSKDLHQLGIGKELNILGQQKELIIGLIVNNELDKVIQYKNLRAITNLDYKIKDIFIKSNLGYDRHITFEHPGYKIKEGIHTVPMINDTEKLSEVSDVRGSWIYIELTVESLEEFEINITGIINDLRFSHQ